MLTTFLYNRDMISGFDDDNDQHNNREDVLG